MDGGSVKLVCFDLGGVILRICHSWAEGCEAAGLDVRGDIEILRARRDDWQDVNDDLQCGRIDVEAYADRFSELITGLYTPAEVLRIYDAWILGEYAGVGTLIDQIHEAGLETAVLSNSSIGHWQTLPRYAAAMKLRNRLGSHELGVRKPEPAAYHAVEAATTCHGREILFFDDRPENIAAARARGWNCEQIDPSGSPAAQMADVLERAGVRLA